MSKELPKKYTPEEDLKIWNSITEAQGEGKALDPVFAELSEDLGRSTMALEYRFYSVLKKKPPIVTPEPEPEPEPAPEFSFMPYTGEEDRKGKKRVGNPHIRVYSPEDDQRILEAIQVAEDAGIPFSAIWHKLADEMQRTPKAIEQRGGMLKKRYKEDHSTEETDDEDDGEGESVASKIRTIMKERDFYKARYEAAEEKLKDYDRMAKDYRKIRRLLE